ncbi:MAG: tetratricopeptide repeat protein [Proteobacteria bacterium]|jgi:Flp pilus assembly protein TadD|nr:tetratricopeptide repeat protein [Pseudomonadota bacterium]
MDQRFIQLMLLQTYNKGALAKIGKFFLPSGVLIAFSFLLQACTTVEQRDDREASVDEQSIVSGSYQQPREASETSAAVEALYAQLKVHIDSGNLDEGARVLERALRIEPSNPEIWHRMAQIKFMQADYSQAVVTASRSNTFAGRNESLRQSNLALMLQSYVALGDNSGAERIRAQIGSMQ